MLKKTIPLISKNNNTFKIIKIVFKISIYLMWFSYFKIIIIQEWKRRFKQQHNDIILIIIIIIIVLLKTIILIITEW